MIVNDLEYLRSARFSFSVRYAVCIEKNNDKKSKKNPTYNYPSLLSM